MDKQTESMPNPPMLLRVSRDANIIYPYSQTALVAYLTANKWKLVRDDDDDAYQVYRGGLREPGTVWIIKDSWVNDDSKEMPYSDVHSSMRYAIQTIQRSDGRWLFDLLGDLQIDMPIERPEHEFEYIYADAAKLVQLPWELAPEWTNYGTVNADGQITWWYSKPHVEHGSTVWDLDMSEMDENDLQGGWSRYGPYIDIPRRIDWREICQPKQRILPSTLIPYDMFEQPLDEFDEIPPCPVCGQDAAVAYQTAFYIYVKCSNCQHMCGPVIMTERLNDMWTASGDEQ
jgi:hypothetical protein